MASTSTTRLNDEVFLIGPRAFDPLSRMKQLPTVKQVLQRFHYHLKEIKTVRNASHLTLEEVVQVWSKGGIPTKLVTHIIEKLEQIHSSWLLLKKNKGRSSKAQQEREQGFKKKLHSLFDIAHADALTLIKIKEDSDFLLDQRSQRKMYLGSKDKELIKRQERAFERKTREEERKKRAISGVTSASAVFLTICDSENSESATQSDADDDDFIPSQRKISIQKEEHNSILPTAQLFTPHVTSALDRNKTSDREALRLMIPIAAALGHDPSTLPLSRSTIQRTRKKARKEYVELAMSEFKPDCPLVVHWDGKLLPEILGLGTVDRLPVFVSGDGIVKLLGVPKLSAGTGENAVKSIFSLLEQWNIVKNVQALSFDTTNVNTGCLKGACVLLEEKIGHQLLWLACRHHVMELILAKVFTVCFGPSSSPDISLFKRFKAVWEGIVRINFRRLESKASSKEFEESTIACFLNVAESQIIRDDYKELIELTLAVLGNSPKKMHWRAPGAIHHARWMAKLLYAFKIFLFRDQRDVFSLTKWEETQLQRFVQFGALLYSKAWIEAPLAAEAPGGDLKLWEDLRKYEAIDSEIGIAGRKVLERHLWYLSDELVGLALFSDRVPVEEKQKIIAGINNAKSPRNVRGHKTILKDGVSLGDFATKRTAELLPRFQICESILSLSPEQWENIIEYQNGRERIRQLRVVNDTAERGVQLIQEFNKLLTNNEEDKQFLLQVVEANRKTVPTETTKKSLMNTVCKKKM